jgi:tetratricopeptide (TPR) repeat protein/predicted Ser/Thr protein kinase
VAEPQRPASGLDEEETLAEGETVRTGEELVRGDSVDRYVILDRLGAGGMGVVYAAYDPELDRKLAIKQLRGDAREQTSLGRTRLAREARAMAQLSHPNVVTVHDVGESGGAVFIAMEFVEGRTLREWVGTHPPWQEIMRVYLEAARGLAAAHAAGLIHRDFKPENVMLGDDGRVRVMDFGLARGGHERELAPAMAEREPAAELSLTRAGAIVGSPAYMSPEQHLGELADARSDQFSFCVALHEALYGRRPFLGDSLIELATKITQGERAPPPKAREIPGWIYVVLERGLARDPAQRWPSMAVLIEQLDRKPQRRSWVTGVGVVTLAAAIALIVGRRDSQPTAEPVDLCTAGDQHIAKVWNDEHRAALEAALLATEQPWAAQTQRVVETELDAYAGRWKAGWRDACEATHVRHEQSGQRLDQRMECLERRRSELAGLLEGLEHADTKGLSDAARVVVDLSAVEACADPSYLDDQGRLPEDPREAAEVEALLAEIDHLSGRQAAGDHAQLVESVEQSLTRARALGHPLVLIEALTLAATSAVHVGEIERPRERLEEAYFIARAEGYDYAAAKLSTKLLFHARDIENPVQATRSWMPHAQADVERAGADPILQATLWGRMASAYELSGEFLEAEAHARKAVALLEDTHGTLHPIHIETLGHLAQILAKHAKYAEAAAIYQQAFELVRTRLGDRHPTMAQLRNNYAIVLVHDAQFELALQHIEAAKLLYVELFGPNHPSLPAVLSNQAQAFQGLGDYQAALDLCLEATAQRVKLHGPEHPNVAWTQAAAASQLNRLGRHDEALALARETVELIVRQLGPESHLLAYGLLEQGIAEHGLGRGRAALATLERALALREGSDADPSTVATVEWPLARVSWDLGEHERALELARSARATYAGDAPLWRPTIVEIDAWLAERTGGASGPAVGVDL